MWEVLLVAAAGFGASFVDGSLGMGFGPTSSSLLLMSGLPPAGVSTTVNLAKVVTGVAGGASHWRLGNVDRRLVLRLAVPGTIGAAVGAYLLTAIDGDQLRPALAALLFLVGLRILVRFRRPVARASDADAADAGRGKGVVVAGATGGVTNGLIGAWGPVVTPYLLHRRVPPRFVVGSVNTAEVAVAVVAAGSLLGAGVGDVSAVTVAAMLGGGVIAAPIAAWTIRYVAPRLLGVLVAGVLLATNARELLVWADVGPLGWLTYLAVVAAVAEALSAPRRDARRQRARQAASSASSARISGSSSPVTRSANVT